MIAGRRSRIINKKMAVIDSYPLKGTFSGDLYVDATDIINDRDFDYVLTAVEKIEELQNKSRPPEGDDEEPEGDN